MADTNKQERLMLDHMEHYGSISTMEAVRKYNILRPASRVHDLKAKGYDIHTEIVYRKTRNGSHTHYAVYSLVKS